MEKYTIQYPLSHSQQVVVLSWPRCYLLDFCANHRAADVNDKDDIFRNYRKSSRCKVMNKVTIIHLENVRSDNSIMLHGGHCYFVQSIRYISVKT